MKVGEDFVMLNWAGLRDVSFSRVSRRAEESNLVRDTSIFQPLEFKSLATALSKCNIKSQSRALAEKSSTQQAPLLDADNIAVQKSTTFLAKFY